MKYTDWITELKQNLLSVSEAERRRVIDYYAEAYADRRAAGFSESEIIEGFGAPYDAAQAILEGESPKDMPEKTATEKKSPPQAENNFTENGVKETAPQPSPSAPQPAAVKSNRSGKTAAIVIAVIAAVLVLVAAAFTVLITVGRALYKIEYYEAKYYQLSDDIGDIRINFDAGNFRTEFYDGDKIEIDYFESNAFDVTVKEDGGTLTFRSDLKWYLFWVNYDIPETVIKLPQSAEYNLDVNISAGLINIGGGTFKNLDLKLSAGAVNVKGETVCDRLNVNLSAGKVTVDKVECNALGIDLSAGKVEINSLTCPEINIDLSAGAVDLGVVGKQTDYTVRVRKSAGSCNVSDRTGDVPGMKIDIDLSAGAVNIYFN